LWLHSLKVAQLLRSAACLHTNQSRSYLNHLVSILAKQVEHNNTFIGFQPFYFLNLFHFHVTDDINVLNSTGSSALIKLGDGRCVRKYLPGDFGASKCL